MINSLQTSNGVSYLAKQTTDMASVTVDSTVVPTAISNITRSDIVFISNMKLETMNVQQMVYVEQVIF